MALIQTILTFHSIGPLERQAGKDEMRYNVSAEQFAKWMAAISRSQPQCLVTFDDGNKSDIEIALPILKKHNVTAKFFPTISQIGQQDYMTWDDIRSLVAAGMQVGSHGLDHVAWTECSPDQLLNELQQSRETLQQQLDTPINCAAAPFGAISPLVYHAARRAGYTKLYTSSPRSSFTATNLVSRYSVQSNMIPADVIASHTTLKERAGTALQNLAQNIKYSVSQSS